jgi:hypothetical protein
VDYQGGTIVFKTTDHSAGAAEAVGVEGSNLCPSLATPVMPNKATPSCPSRHRDRNAGFCTNGGPREFASRSVPRRWIRVPCRLTALRQPCAPFAIKRLSTASGKQRVESHWHCTPVPPRATVSIMENCPDTTALRLSGSQRRDKGVAILPKAISWLPCPNFFSTTVHTVLSLPTLSIGPVASGTYQDPGQCLRVGTLIAHTGMARMRST